MDIERFLIPVLLAAWLASWGVGWLGVRLEESKGGCDAWLAVFLPNAMPPRCSNSSSSSSSTTVSNLHQLIYTSQGIKNSIQRGGRCLDSGQTPAAKNKQQQREVSHRKKKCYALRTFPFVSGGAHTFHDEKIWWQFLMQIQQVVGR